MSLLSQENMRKVLDRLIERPSIAAATRSILASNSKVLFVWCRNAARDREDGVDDSPYLVRDWPAEGDATWFDKGVKQTRVMHALTLDSDERDSLSNSERYVFDGSGKLSWTPDPKVAADALSMDEFDWIAEYGARDRSDIWKRDENGALIPLKVKESQPAQMRIHALRALLADLWNPPERREVDNRLSGGGVLVLHGAKSPQPRQPSELETDLRQRLAAIRASGPKNPKPSGAPNFGNGGKSSAAADPPEKVSQASTETPPPHVPDYPRPHTEAPAAPPVDYSRRRHDDAGGQASTGPGKPPPGGFSLTTGRAT